MPATVQFARDFVHAIFSRGVCNQVFAELMELFEQFVYLLNVSDEINGRASEDLGRENTPNSVSTQLGVVEM